MRLLLGVSGDEASWQALRRTVARVRETGDELTIAVVDSTRSDRPTGAVLSEVRSHLDEAGVDARVVHLDGDAGSELVRLAEEEGYDRLVLGGGGESPMGKMELDEIEQYVLLNARTTVTIER
jgi:nucleotide-binding universal stress UspA family protein